MKEEVKTMIVENQQSQSLLSEAFRILRTNIEFSSIDNTIKTILITSPGTREGKSTIVVNLGMVMSKLNKRVILMDCDLRRPKIHHYFNQGNTIGITNIIVNELNYKDVIKPVASDNLYILTTGPIPPNPSEILASNKMKSLLTQIKDTFEIVLIDSPPTGMVTDAAILSHIVDGVLLVCAAEETSIEDAQRAKKLLKQAKGNLMGVILNKVPLPKEQYHYY